MGVRLEPAEIRRTALMWADIVYLQTSRLEQAVDKFHVAVSDAPLCHSWLRRPVLG